MTSFIGKKKKKSPGLNLCEGHITFALFLLGFFSIYNKHSRNICISLRRLCWTTSLFLLKTKF